LPGSNQRRLHSLGPVFIHEIILSNQNTVRNFTWCILLTERDRTAKNRWLFLSEFVVSRFRKNKLQLSFDAKARRAIHPCCFTHPRATPKPSEGHTQHRVSRVVHQSAAGLPQFLARTEIRIRTLAPLAEAGAWVSIASASIIDYMLGSKLYQTVRMCSTFPVCGRFQNVQEPRSDPSAEFLGN